MHRTFATIVRFALAFSSGVLAILLALRSSSAHFVPRLGVTTTDQPEYLAYACIAAAFTVLLTWLACIRSD